MTGYVFDFQGRQFDPDSKVTPMQDWEKHNRSHVFGSLLRIERQLLPYAEDEMTTTAKTIKAFNVSWTADQMSDKERIEWVNNDEGLYRWWKSERGSVREFVRRNRREIDAAVEHYQHRHDGNGGSNCKQGCPYFNGGY